MHPLLQKPQRPRPEGRLIVVLCQVLICSCPLCPSFFLQSFQLSRNPISFRCVLPHFVFVCVFFRIPPLYVNVFFLGLSSFTNIIMGFLMKMWNSVPDIYCPYGNNSNSSMFFGFHQASLETVKVGSGKDGRYALLNCDDHQNILKKHNR